MSRYRPNIPKTLLKPFLSGSFAHLHLLPPLFKAEQTKSSEIYHNFLANGCRKLILGSKVSEFLCLYTLQKNFLLYFYQLGSYFPKTRFVSKFYSIFSNYVIVKQLMKYRTLIPEQQVSFSMLLIKCRISIVLIFKSSNPLH